MKYGMGYAYWGNTWECDLEKYRKVGKKLADFGFDMFEISADHLYHMSDADVEGLGEMAKEYGLTLSTNSGPAKQYDFASADPAVRQNGLAYFTKVLKRMDIIGSPVLAGAIYSFWPTDFVETDKEAAWERSIPMLREVGKIAEGYGIECALEVLNRNETYILTDCKEAIEYCDRIGSKAVNILLDTYHMNIEEDDMCDAIRQAGNRNLLGHFHVGENNRKLPGMNNSLDWAGIGQALRDVHYDKGVVMEPFLHNGGAVGYDVRVWRDLSGGADIATQDEYLKTSLAFLKEKFEG
ncbi:MAG: sugar phosphate isomerase/epimerase [Lachnospiraceae bacterium]|nr:sugar phosphate isomerase/epimerase [Lachnospiraceae bacterium]